MLDYVEDTLILRTTLALTLNLNTKLRQLRKA